MDDPARHLARNLKTIRTHRGLSQVQLSDESEVSVTTIARIEGKQSNASFATVIALADVLQVPVGYLADENLMDTPEAPESAHVWLTPGALRSSRGADEDEDDEPPVRERRGPQPLTRSSGNTRDIG